MGTAIVKWKDEYKEDFINLSIEWLEKYLKDIADINIDAYIIADIGVLSLVKKISPKKEIHISTQASIVSAEGANMYASLGAKRVVLSRELTFDEIADIRKNTPPD